ncbi:unnamed protein product [Bursaphelenchus okinawaensis]|uniref:Uncharacterized protein n=1 Tax=Bursaphelenchus okinawaensis TaxID=465554 RepID=A0A811KJW9_9BILA|nr:unnamed protein product [Bursaphelenchus okinawaensis]CAG9104374.1 unnamed protein product [Bursaphelenchus okinawaensis]
MSEYTLTRVRSAAALRNAKSLPPGDFVNTLKRAPSVGSLPAQYSKPYYLTYYARTSPLYLHYSNDSAAYDDWYDQYRFAIPRYHPVRNYYNKYSPSFNYYGRYPYLYRSYQLNYGAPYYPSRHYDPYQDPYVKRTYNQYTSSLVNPYWH